MNDLQGKMLFEALMLAVDRKHDLERAYTVIRLMDDHLRESNLAVPEWWKTAVGRLPKEKTL